MKPPGVYRCPVCGQVIVIYIPVLMLCCGRDHIKPQPMEKVDEE